MGPAQVAGTGKGAEKVSPGSAGGRGVGVFREVEGCEGSKGLLWPPGEMETGLSEASVWHPFARGVPRALRVLALPGWVAPTNNCVVLKELPVAWEGVRGGESRTWI